MTLEKAQRFAQLANQLAEMLMTVVICSEAMRTTILAGLDGDGRRPLVDSSTLSLLWEGKTCRLGGKVLFRLAERLCRRPKHACDGFKVLDGCQVQGGLAAVIRCGYIRSVLK